MSLSPHTSISYLDLCAPVTLRGHASEAVIDYARAKSLMIRFPEVILKLELLNQFAVRSARVYRGASESQRFVPVKIVRPDYRSIEWQETLCGFLEHRGILTDVEIYLKMQDRDELLPQGTVTVSPVR